MSRVYFHSPSETAELLGSERGWLRHLAHGLALAAWDLDGASDLERAVEIVQLVPEVEDGQYGANYLHNYMRQALAEQAANKEVYARPDWRTSLMQTSHDAQHRFVQSLKTSLSVNGLELNVAGVKLNTSNLDLNTALVAGSRPIQLAAKIHGWCESHCWVDGPDRAWMAEIIDEGLQPGLYRRGWRTQEPDGGFGPWRSQGWEDVQALLRSRDDEPVVLSYSVCDQFPNSSIADWMPAWPEGVPETWEGYESLSDEVKQEREDRQDAWYDVDADERWRLAMEGLRARRPWARLDAETLTGVTFHYPVTVYDLFAPDRDERIRAAAGLDPSSEEAHTHV